ncbi:MAG: LamG domain-containing protein [Candidatus Hydrogenedentes bacterium]|nr:LamG domain-containing protein [Candidatus Hydrogenedentota bacterium]
MWTQFIVPALVACTWAAWAAADAGLAGEWRFEEGRDNHIHDRSGNNNHGLAEGVKWIELSEKYALEFGKPGSHVNCGRPAGLDLTKAITLEAWLFPSAPAASETGIAGKSFSSYGLTYYTDGKAYWYIGSGGNKCSAPLAAGDWAHLVGTFDGTRLNLYVNGALVDSTESQFAAIPHGGDFLIGCIAKGGHTESFRGVIGAVRVYDRALSEDEIRAQYAAEAADYPAPPPRYDRLVVWPFCYPDDGAIILDADFSAVYPIAATERVTAEVWAAGGQQPLQRHDLPPVPRSGVLREARIEIGALPAGDYRLRVAVEAEAGVRAEWAEPFTHPQPIAVPAPSERTVPPIAPRPIATDYTVEVHDAGGFTVIVDGQPYPVESTYSYPHGGYNALSVPGAPASGAEADWQVTAEAAGAGQCRVTAQGAHYRVERRIEQRPGCVYVTDTFTNTCGAVLGILLSNHVRADAIDGLRTQLLPNPSVFLHKPGQGVGLVALDDVYLEQYATFDADGRCGIRSDRFGLDAGASYAIEWAVYVNGTGDYYDFVNQVRQDEGLIPTVEGGFAFTDRREPPSAEYVAARALRYASIGCLGNVPDDPGLSLEGIEFAEYPQECALLKATFAETRRRFPDIKVMFHIAHSLYTTNAPTERFPESRVINAAGVQTDYGGQNVDYYAKYFSQERVDEGYRWYIFYPAMDNRFGKAMLDAVDYMLDELGVNGMFADGFTHGYGGRFTYDRWDGHTVEIDPDTKTVVRQYASVNLLAQDVLLEVIRRVNAKGGIVIANSYPGTRTVHRERILYCLETAGGGKVCSRLHFAPSVIALGNPADLESDRDVYDDLRDKLDWGGLYFYYGEKVDAPDTIVTQMYPITVEEIGAGLVKGRERLITLHAGVYGWPGDDALHFVYRYDGRGVPVAHAFPTTVDNAGVRTDIALGENEAAVIKKIPVAIRAASPVNLVVVEYGPDGLELALNGAGDAVIEVRHGAFPVRPGAQYALRAGDSEQAVAAGAAGLSCTVPLRGQLRVRIRPATQ